MTERKKAIYAKFHQALPWLAKFFSQDNKALVPLSSPEQHVIFDTIAANWEDGDIIATLNDLREHYGAKVAEVIDLALAANTRKDWAEIGKQQASRTIDDFLRILWEPLPAIGFEYTATKTAEGMQMHCTKCPLVQLGQILEGADWMYHLVCGGDPHMVAGFNPQMGFRRTKTLMQGDAYCDHYYFMKAA